MMVSDLMRIYSFGMCRYVLILVLVDDGLWHKVFVGSYKTHFES